MASYATIGEAKPETEVEGASEDKADRFFSGSGGGEVRTGGARLKVFKALCLSSRLASSKYRLYSGFSLRCLI